MRYPAFITRAGRSWVAEFPDCSGCQTVAASVDALREAAKKALEGWLEAHLEHGQVPPVPKKRQHLPAGAKLDYFRIDPTLAIAVNLRQARDKAGLTQSELATKAGVSQQQIAKLEGPGSNPKIATVEKVARALGLHFVTNLSTEIGENGRSRSKRRPVRNS